MKIAIIGFGKMGSWFAKELAKNNEVAVYDVVEPGQISRIKTLSDLSQLEKFKPEMLVNAVSLQNTTKAFEAAVDYITKDCTIVDIASIKGEIPKYYEKSGHKFVSLHPMFGPTLTDMQSLNEESVIIIKESDVEGKEFFTKFFSSFGLKIFEYSFKEHDEMMAYSLTTPFAASLVFAACVDKTIVPGTTFKRHLKVSRGLLSEDDHLLSEILFNPNSIKQLEKINSRLEFLKHIIKARDFEEAKRFFNNLRKNIQN